VPYVASNIAFFDLGQHRTPRQHLDRATDLAAELGVELLIWLQSRQAPPAARLSRSAAITGG
jgi:hypothetical protein